MATTSRLRRTRAASHLIVICCACELGVVSSYVLDSCWCTSASVQVILSMRVPAPKPNSIYAVHKVMKRHEVGGGGAYYDNYLILGCIV